ncbi:MAG TPA: 5'-nucleotidase C-terminal domain-containing protein, partial [Vicinamibacteria bacterium]|nr:5'-nucleotidase C-terminal domain-containing protein [Vicinamibacteria bacterium]
LIRDLRSKEPNPFLFDAGDIFTGALAKLTEGELAFELMISMGYDAMGIGNHEFEYGAEIFAWEKNRAPFPVLGANLFYRGTSHPYAQPHAVVERNGVRIGVIGIMGQDAATAIIPSFIAPLDVKDPAEAVRRSVEELRDEVDLIVLLTHQGKTAPMQTDAESDPRLQRDIDADYTLAGAVEGVDVLLAGHADAGTLKPVVHEKTGTLIMQTYGQATHLGYLQVKLDSRGKIASYDGKLIPVDSERLTPDPEVRAKLEKYRVRYPELFEKVGRTEARMNRRYIEESDVGNLFADIFAGVSGADIAFVHSGSLRKDLPRGNVARVDILDTYPFVDAIVVLRMTGDQIRRALEQSLTLERGLLQVAGVEIVYDLSKPERQRLVSMRRQGRPIEPGDELEVAVSGFLAEGGDLYESFPEATKLRTLGKVSDVVIDFFKGREVVEVPPRGRQRSGETPNP